VRRIMLVVQYDGTDYAGFQIQPDQPTIQGELEKALAEVEGTETRVTGASRTDAGVHALGQIATLETENPIPVPNLVRALNDHLPPAITVPEGTEVASAFHPCYSASGKLYSYRILNRPAGSPFITRYAWHVPDPVLDVAKMQEAAAILCGQHDFAAFASAGGKVENTVRDIFRFDVERHRDILEVHIEGNGFLYQMVRNMVGTLVEVGSGRCDAEEVAKLLQSRDRTLVGAPAPPQGLCLVRVYY